MRGILVLITLAALLLTANASIMLPVTADTGTIIAHKNFSGAKGKIMVTTYVYKDTSETVPTEDFYAFKIRVHAYEWMSDVLVSIYSPQGICDLWEPTEGWYAGGSVSFGYGGIKFSIPLPSGYVDVSGEYTHKIGWTASFGGFWPYYMVYDADFAAGFYTSQGSGLEWTINVQAGRMSGSWPPGVVWIDHATWSTAAEQIDSRVGYLSGDGATSTFSISDVYGTYTVGMVGNEVADFDLYAKWNSAPTTSSYDARGFSGFSSEYFSLSGGGIAVYNKGTLYVMVRSWRGSGYWKCNVVAGSPTVNGGRKYGTLSGSGATATYSVAGTGRAWVYLAGPDGSDFDLYLKWNSPPTTSSYDARGFSGYSQEIVTAKGSGTLYYMVRSWRGSGQFSVIALIF